METSDNGVSFISLVDEPAIMVDFIKLSKQQISFEFSADKEKQLLFGPFLIPDMLIYRNNETIGEHYIRFSKEEIEKISDKFNNDSNNNNINFMHSDVKVNGFVSRNWIIDGELDQSKKYNFDLPDGTWFGGVKIKDNDFWLNEVKGDKVKGFSVEIKGTMDAQLKINKNMENIENLADNAPVTPTDPNAPADNAPADNTPLTKDDVMAMIDLKYQALNDEIMAIRDELSKLTGDAPVDPNKPVDESKLSELTERLKSMEEKLSSTPAVETVVKFESKEVSEFNKSVNKLRKFNTN